MVRMWDRGVNAILADEMVRSLLARRFRLLWLCCCASAVLSRKCGGGPRRWPVHVETFSFFFLEEKEDAACAETPPAPPPPPPVLVQGLGKTLQTISLLSYLKFERDVQVGVGVRPTGRHRRLQGPLCLLCKACLRRTGVFADAAVQVQLPHCIPPACGVR